MQGIPEKNTKHLGIKTSVQNFTEILNFKFDNFEIKPHCYSFN